MIKNDENKTTWNYTVATYENDVEAVVSYDRFIGIKTLTPYDLNNDGLNEAIQLESEQTDTLRAVNIYDGCSTKRFVFRTEEDGEEEPSDIRTYTLTDNLGVTSKTLYVEGIKQNLSVIDAGGYIEDIDNNVKSAPFSMFQVINPSTTVVVSDVLIKGAALGDGTTGSNIGSVFDIGNASSISVTLKNVTLSENAGVIEYDADGQPTAKSAAIYNKAKLILENVTFNAQKNNDISNNIINDAGKIEVKSTEGNSNIFASHITNMTSGNIDFLANSYSQINDYVANIGATAKINILPDAEVYLGDNAHINISMGEMNVSGKLTSSAAKVSVGPEGKLSLKNEGSYISEQISINLLGSLIIENNSLKQDDANVNEVNYGLILGSGDMFINDGADNKGFIDLKNNGVLSLRKGLMDSFDDVDTDVLTLNNKQISGDETSIIYNGLSGSDVGMKIEILSDEAGFAGTYYQYGASSSLVVGYVADETNPKLIKKQGKIFTGEKYIDEKSSLEVYLDSLSYGKIHLGKDAKYTHYATKAGQGEINNDLLKFFSSGAVAKFTYDANMITISDDVDKTDMNARFPVVYTLYNLSSSPSIQTNGIYNDVIFEGVQVKFQSVEYLGSNAYSFIDSLINVMEGNENALYNTYKFTKVSFNNSELNLDIDMKTDASDKLEIDNGGYASGIITISDINIVNFDTSKEATYQIIINNNYGNLELALSETITNPPADSDFAWDYKIDETNPEVRHTDYIGRKGIELATTQTQNDSIKIYNEQQDTLSAISTFESALERKFIFVQSDNPVYTLISNVGMVSAGQLKITGLTGGESVIDAQYVNINNETRGYSLFEIKDNSVELYITDVTIKNAGEITSTGSSVLHINNNNSKVSLEDVVLVDNAQNAISNVNGQ
ncbi:hypothetical protein IKJ53_03080, partial [bacterium]|nr:hypothetical protein [bacterium]